MVRGERKKEEEKKEEAGDSGVAHLGRVEPVLDGQPIVGEGVEVVHPFGRDGQRGRPIAHEAWRVIILARLALLVTLLIILVALILRAALPFRTHEIVSANMHGKCNG
jgi:hypothetical protein